MSRSKKVRKSMENEFDGDRKKEWLGGWLDFMAYQPL